MNTEQKRQKFLDIVEKNGSSFMGLVFLKKDGSPRDARFNPRDFNEIKGTGKPCTDPNIFRFREVHNKEEKKLCGAASTLIAWLVSPLRVKKRCSNDTA